MTPAHGINILFPDGTEFYVPTTEDHGMMVAVVDEFLDQCETHPQGPNYENLGVRFLAWYAGNTDMGIQIGAGVATSTVTVGWTPDQDDPAKPTVW